MERFTSRFNRVMAVAAWVIVAAAIVGYVWAHGGMPQPLWLIPAALAAFLAWAWLWRPAVEVSDEGVTIVNLVRTVEVPWEALIQVDTQFALTLRTPRGTYTAWAAPAPGRTGTALARRREARAASAGVPGVGASARPGDLVGTESGDAAAIIRTRWDALREAGRIELGVAESTPVRSRIHWVQDAVTLALVAGTATAALLAR